MYGWIFLGVVVLVLTLGVVGAIVYKNNKDKIAKAAATVKTVVADVKGSTAPKA
jgi:flagellar basal body-associated protein FliL